MAQSEDNQRRANDARTATLSNVAGTTSSTTLLAVKRSRVGFLIFNDSTANLFVKFGSTAASSTSYTVKIAAGGLYENPGTFNYTGAITGIWSAADGNARVTEVS